MLRVVVFVLLWCDGVGVVVAVCSLCCSSCVCCWCCGVDALSALLCFVLDCVVLRVGVLVC